VGPASQERIVRLRIVRGGFRLPRLVTRGQADRQFADDVLGHLILQRKDV
jgi:hypothetical protein